MFLRRGGRVPAANLLVALGAFRRRSAISVRNESAPGVSDQNGELGKKHGETGRTPAD